MKFENREAGEGQSTDVDLSDMLAIVTPRLGQFHAILDYEYKAPGELAGTTFPASKPLGSLKLKVLDLFVFD